MISVHYYRKDVEEPVNFAFYRRLEELQRRGAESVFKEKNEIARTLFTMVCNMPGAPRIVVMDSFFMTKENVTLLKKLGREYVFRPKRNWDVSYEHMTCSLEALFNTIPSAEFKETTLVNPKTKAMRKYLTATRKVFIPKVGMHTAVFIDCIKPRPENKEPEDSETVVTLGERKFRVFIASNLAWDAATILAIYAVRWTIETSYKDINQDLDLHGCKWRELNGQYCFIVLTFLCYS
nr:transposase [Candidatus Sigynarchaeum springense]